MRFQSYILCLVLLFIAASCSWATWTADITVTVATNSQGLTFGEHSEALDGFDNMDVPAPPLPPTGQSPISLGAAFRIIGLFPRLTTDIKQQGPDKQWDLEIRSDTGDLKLAWDVTNVPSDKSISLICPNADGIGYMTVNMRTEGSLELPRGLYTLTLEVIQREPIKGDVNNDGEVNIDDIRLIIQMLMMPEMPTINRRNTADINDDGKISPTDVMLLMYSRSNLAPSRLDVDEDTAIAVNKAQQDTASDGASKLSSPILPESKHITTWAAIKTH